MLPMNSTAKSVKLVLTPELSIICDAYPVAYFNTGSLVGVVSFDILDACIHALAKQDDLRVLWP